MRPKFFPPVIALLAAALMWLLDSHFPLSELAEAFRHQEAQRHFGKICIDI